jgi:hypothetical protein
MARRSRSPHATVFLVLCGATRAALGSIPQTTPPRAAAAPAAAGRCVVTDVDDTLKSSGGLMIAGIALGGVDRAFARGAYYPGVFQLQFELSLHGLPPGARAHPPAILTARAIELLAFLEIKPDSKLCKAFEAAAAGAGGAEAARGWRVGDVLYGSVQEWILQDRKAWRKVTNFESLADRRARAGRAPAGGYVFFGDNGYSERDEEAVAGISRTGLLAAAFIHAVSDDPNGCAPPPADRATAEGAPVVYFETYARAALKAAALGLLSADALLRVVDAAERDARADPTNLPSGGANAAVLRADAAEARAYAAGGGGGEGRGG